MPDGNATLKKRGQPAHEPTEDTRKQVERMVALGMTQDEIGGVIGVSDDTLRKHYPDELKHGYAKVLSKVGSNYIDRMLSDKPEAVGATKFFLQARAGWKERQEQEHSGAVRFVVETGVPR